MECLEVIWKLLTLLSFVSWDEWVGYDRLMKFTEENLQKQKEINEKQKMEMNAKTGRSLQNKPKSSIGR